MQFPRLNVVSNAVKTGLCYAVAVLPTWSINENPAVLLAVAETHSLFARVALIMPWVALYDCSPI